MAGSDARLMAKERVTIICSRCGLEVEASPGIAKYALDGKAVCARCEGTFRARGKDKVNGSN